MKSQYEHTQTQWKYVVWANKDILVLVFTIKFNLYSFAFQII